MGGGGCLSGDIQVEDKKRGELDARQRSIHVVDVIITAMVVPDCPRPN